jgi:hypothetical protein
MKHNSCMGSSSCLCKYMAKSCLPSIYTYHLTYKFSPRPGFSVDISNSLRLIDSVFSYYSAHIKVYRYWPFGVVNLCLANELSSAGDASDP